MDMFVVKRPNPVSSTAASPVARKKARQGDVTCLIYVVKTLYFCRSITALFVIFTAPVPHFLAKLLVRYRTFLQEKPHQNIVPGILGCRIKTNSTDQTTINKST